MRLLLGAVRTAGRLLAAFIFLNAAGEVLQRGFAMDHFWISSPRVLGPLWRVPALMLAAALLVPESLLSRRPWLRRAGLGLCLFFEFFACLDCGRFWWLLLEGTISTPAILPFSALVALLMVLSAWRIHRADSEPESNCRSFALGMALRCSAAAATGVVAFLAMLFTYGPTDYSTEADCAVVLGSRAYRNGRPSLALSDRAMTAIRLYKRGVVRKIVMSGGVDSYRDGTRVSEPRVCRRLAMDHGVPECDIILDEDGVNSWATVVNARKLADRYGWREVLLVSHYYHLPRLRMSADRAGLRRARTVPCRQTRRLRKEPWGIARECAGMAYYYFLRWPR